MGIKEFKARIARRLLRQPSLADDGARVSYSQSGEDLIIDFFFSVIRKKPLPSYLDIGAYHPAMLSNTYYFYLKGSIGVCVEPDPSLFAAFRKRRSRDVLLNVGIGNGEACEADFYVMTAKTLNTFSAEHAKQCHENTEYKITKVIKVPLLTVNEIIKQNFSAAPDFVSLDIEGYDLTVMNDFDFDRCRPELFCIETMDFTSVRKNYALFQLMQNMGYMIYADTRLNTIFVDDGLI